MNRETTFPFTPENFKERNYGIAPARVIKDRLKETQEYIKAHPPVSKVNTRGYIFYTRQDNLELFERLELCGFFDFHCTNTKKAVVMEHQVNKYIFGSGWKYYLKGYTCKKDTVEIHHLDGDVTNNNPRNLAYVSPQVNKLCAQACKLQYFGTVKKKMKETLLQAANIIALSVKRTYKRLYDRVPNISPLQWLMSLPAALKTSCNPKWQIEQSLLAQLS